MDASKLTQNLPGRKSKFHLTQLKCDFKDDTELNDISAWKSKQTPF